MKRLRYTLRIIPCIFSEVAHWVMNMNPDDPFRPYRTGDTMRTRLKITVEGRAKH